MMEKQKKYIENGMKCYDVMCENLNKILEYYENLDDPCYYQTTPKDVADALKFPRPTVYRWFSEGNKFLELDEDERKKQPEGMNMCGQMVAEWNRREQKELEAFRGTMVREGAKNFKDAVTNLQNKEAGSLFHTNKSQIDINKTETKTLNINAKIEQMSPQQLDAEIKKLNDSERKMLRNSPIYPAQEVEYEEVNERTG